MKTTHHISITVEPFYLEDQSLPMDRYYVWAYNIWIENQSAENVQLMKRKWRIIDASGMMQEISGEGVGGEKPWIAPGATYHYTSGTPLSTSSGMMQGTYQMQTSSGKIFEVEIPPFSLDSPYETRIIH